jgi:hypothetical protein
MIYNDGPNFKVPKDPCKDLKFRICSKLSWCFFLNPISGQLDTDFKMPDSIDFCRFKQQGTGATECGSRYKDCVDPMWEKACNAILDLIAEIFGFDPDGLHHLFNCSTLTWNSEGIVDEFVDYIIDELLKKGLKELGEHATDRILQVKSAAQLAIIGGDILCCKSNRDLCLKGVARGDCP